MFNKSGFNAEINRGNMFQQFLSKVFLRAFAEEKPEGDEGGESTTNPSLNFEQMVAQARKEEKDKLYPRIKKAEDENKTLTASVNKYLLENAALKDELNKLKNKPEDDSKVKELTTKIETLEKENKALKESTPNEEEIRSKIEKEYEVKLYAEKQIAENKDSIISLLIPDIKGETKEEIDSAIQAAKDKTLSIKKDLGIDVDSDEGNRDHKDITETKKKQKQKKVPPAAPSVEDEDSEFDAEYIRNLDPRSKEYAEFRKKMGLR